MPGFDLARRKARGGAMTTHTASATDSCPLCGCERPTRLFVKEEVPYYSCPGCEFCYAKPVGNPNFPEDLEGFESAYLQYLDADSADEKNHAYLCSWMARYGNLKGRTLLDVGCGSGKLVRY